MKPPKTKPALAPETELCEGMTLTQEEFHRRYLAYPEDVKFELIGGVVYMASPLLRPHSGSSPLLAGISFLYQATTPGVATHESQTTILGKKSEVQPDLLLRLLEECGGQSRFDENERLIGDPEMVAEVSDATRSRDLNAKKKDYSDAGVQEYIVVDLQKAEIVWFHFPSKSKLKANADGVFKSKVFPGFWLHGPALLATDSAQLLATIQEGVASQQHAKFVQQLARRRAQQP